MASKIYQNLIKKPYDFSFDQVVFLLEKVVEPISQLGDALSVQQEGLRIKSHMALSHPSCEVQKIVLHQYKKPVIYINFLGISGIQGTYDDTDLTPQFNHFLDIFHHRMAGLWTKARRVRHVNLLNLPFDKSLPGHMMAALSGPWAKSHVQLIPFFHLFFSSQRSQIAIECLLSNLLDRRVHFNGMRGEYVSPPPCELSRLKQRFSTLGHDLVIGRRSFNPVKGVEVSFFSHSFDELSKFFPNSPLSQFIHKTLCHLMKKPINIFLKISFKKNTVQPCVLGRSHHLQWNTFLKTAKDPVVEFKL